MNLETRRAGCEGRVRDIANRSERCSRVCRDSCDDPATSPTSLQCDLAFPCVKQQREDLCYIRRQEDFTNTWIRQSEFTDCAAREEGSRSQRGVVKFPERDRGC